MKRPRKWLRVALMAVAALAMLPLGSAHNARLEATEWQLYVDFILIGVCATSCPDGAEESEYCCWIP